MAHKNHFPLVSILALGMAMPAFAQVEPEQPAPQAEPQADQRDPDRDVIVVTAQKREETVQDIAVAVTAVTAEMRDELGINSITDLTNLTPGLSYTAGNERITLRGIGRNTNNFGAEPGVANYTDGIYQSFASIAGRDNLFVDRIEVLRGPQGTLYGRNSVGGALNIISKRPTRDFEGEFRLGFGNFEQSKVGLALSGPLLGDGDLLRGRVTAYKEVRDEGVYFNYGTNDTEGYNINNYNWEVQLAGDLGDRFSWWTKYTTGGYHMAGPPGGRTTADSLAPYDVSCANSTVAPSVVVPGCAWGNLAASGAVTPNQYWAFSTDPALLSFTQCGNTRTNQALVDPRSINSCQPRFANLDAYNDFAIEAIYSFDNFDVKYLGGYIYYNYKLTDDQDGTPIQSITYTSNAGGTPVPAALGGTPRTVFPEQTLLYNENRAFFSNEVNVISTHDGPLQWITGIYLYQENFAQPVKTFFPNEPLASGTIVRLSPAFGFQGLGPANPERLLSYTNNTGLNNAYGVFAQVDWEFTETLKTTVGVRYSVDNKHIKEEARLFCYLQCGATYADVTQGIWNGVAPGFAGLQPGVSSATVANPTGVTYNLTTGNNERLLEDEWDAVTGTLGLEWTPTNSTLVFGKYTRGYKTGGFNATSMAPLPRTKPEIINSYELGLKHEFAEVDLTTNLSAFFYDYQDIQIPLTVVPATGPNFQIFENIPKVETTGFELESIWRPIDDLTVMFNYAYLKPEITESGIYANGLQLNTAGTALGRPESVEGNVLPQSPEHKLGASISYNWNFENGSSLTPVINWYWRDSFTTSIFNDPETFTPDFAQTDARLIWNDGDGRWTIIGWVRNAFDEDGYDATTAFRRRSANQYGTLTSENFQLYQTNTLTLPRTYGVELQFHF